MTFSLIVPWILCLSNSSIYAICLGTFVLVIIEIKTKTKLPKVANFSSDRNLLGSPGYPPPFYSAIYLLGYTCATMPPFQAWKELEGKGMCCWWEIQAACWKKKNNLSSLCWSGPRSGHFCGYETLFKGIFSLWFRYFPSEISGQFVSGDIISG